MNSEAPTPQELIDAGIDLVEQSRLARLQNDGTLFASTGPNFEAWVQDGTHKQRRLASWILFTTGSEYVIKGVCLEFGLGTIEVKEETGEPFMGTLGPYYQRLKKKPKPHLESFAVLVGKGEDSEKILDWCRNLANIRNRDVHVFVKNVRGQRNFPQLESGLLPLLNLLLDCYQNRASYSI